jgi:hypothetical protein
MARIIRVLLLVVVVVLIAGGVAYWRGWIFHPVKTANATGAGPAKPAAVHKPMVLPSDAPIVGAEMEPAVVDPFAVRLMNVNAMAHKKIVTNAEYHDNDAGQRYFVAIVTSCKDLDALWPIKKGVLDAKVQQPLHLTTDFATFAFVEYFQQGQWGVASCDGTT